MLGSMSHPAGAGFIQLTDPGQATPGMRQALVDCWVEVANAGGAVGFAFPPVGAEEVGTVADRLIADLDPGYKAEGFKWLAGRGSVRWPGALRFPDGDRDEVLMLLALGDRQTGTDRRARFPRAWHRRSP